MTNLLIIITATLILINIVISLFKKSKIDSSSIINSTVNKLIKYKISFKETDQKQVMS